MYKRQFHEAGKGNRAAACGDFGTNPLQQASAVRAGGGIGLRQSRVTVGGSGGRHKTGSKRVWTIGLEAVPVRSKVMRVKNADAGLAELLPQTRIAKV